VAQITHRWAPRSSYPFAIHGYHQSVASSSPSPSPPAPGATGRPLRLLAVDYGERRVGLAVSDPSGTIASPAGYIQRRAGKRPPIAEIVRRGTDLGVEGFVVGLPLDANGEDTPRAREVRRIAAEVEKRTGLPVRLVDERFTTAAALRAIRDMGGSTRGRKGDVDALAATLLLQHALTLSR
jgi:putative Holliday junction resolvase